MVSDRGNLTLSTATRDTQNYHPYLWQSLPLPASYKIVSEELSLIPLLGLLLI